MNDEIKEILEGIEVVIKHDGTLEFNAKELKILLDYITNLQQDLANYVNVILHDRNVIDDYKSRVEKAVEYINTHYLNANEPELLNILQNGSESK